MVIGQLDQEAHFTGLLGTAMGSFGGRTALGRGVCRPGALPVMLKSQTWNGSAPPCVWTVQEPSLRKLAAVA